ncbi:MAG: hypothetical protein ABW098_08190 [Candidatus Thiodiazotropha sp.]
MSDFIDNLLIRTIDNSAMLLPRPLSHFEPTAAADLPPYAERTDAESVSSNTDYEGVETTARPRRIETPPKAWGQRPLPIGTEEIVERPVSPGPRLTREPKVLSLPQEVAESHASVERGGIERQTSTEAAPLSPAPAAVFEVAQTPRDEPLPSPAPNEVDPAPNTSQAPKTILSPPPAERLEESPLTGHEAASQSQHNILTAMVRQMVLQPATQELPEPARTEPVESPARIDPVAPRMQSLASEPHKDLVAEPTWRRSNLPSEPYPSKAPLRAKREGLQQAIEAQVLAVPIHRPERSPAVAPALKPLTQPLPPLPEVSQSTEVHISIGRVEVRAVTESAVTPAAAKPQAEPEVMSLDTYLAQRTGEKG